MSNIIRSVEIIQSAKLFCRYNSCGAEYAPIDAFPFLLLSEVLPTFISLSFRHILKRLDNSIASFERFFNDELNYDIMLQRVRNSKAPFSLCQLHKIWLLERVKTCRGCRLLIWQETLNHSRGCYESKGMTLEHFTFSDIFLESQERLTYISFVSS